MRQASTGTSQIPVAELSRRARVASRQLARLSNDCRNEILTKTAKTIEENAQRILDSNALDCRAAQLTIAAGKMSSSMFARLRLIPRNIEEMATRVRDVARLPDPLGRRLAATELDENLVLYKETCPLGVIGIVFESRPDVVPQVAALALKSANALLLRGGTEAFQTNQTLVEIWHHSLESFPSVPLEAVELLHTRHGTVDA